MHSSDGAGYFRQKSGKEKNRESYKEIICSIVYE
jgi:hypothetical protein